MTFTYPRRGTFKGEIKTGFTYSTPTGQLHIYQFLHSVDGLIHEIFLHTRDEKIAEEYAEQVINNMVSSSQRLPWPHKAEVTIGSEGLGFEVFEIKIL